jgi:Tol biopolymer transport system component
VRTSARGVFERQNLLAPESGRSHHRIVPECWTAAGSLMFAARINDQTNVWRLSISEDNWRIRGAAEQVTFGAGREDHPSMSADGSLVFSVLTHKSDVWGLPIHAQTGEPSGPMVRLTSGEGNHMRPVVSRDGSRLAFLTNRAGSQDVWVKDLKTNVESELTATREQKDSPILSPDGSQVAFGHPPPNREAIFVVPFVGGKITRLCEDCGEPRAWFPDGSGLLYQKLSDKGDSLIGLLSPSGRSTPLLQSSESALFSPSVSQDGRWLALLVRTPPNDHRVSVVPLRNGVAAPKEEWIFVTEPGPWVNKPRWSPNGNLLYYVSDRDGFACIWARRLDPVTKKPAGEQQAVVHFHSGHNSLDTAYGMELSVADDKLVFNLGEGSGNIWLLPSANR